MPFADPAEKYKKYKKPTDNPDYIDPGKVLSGAVDSLPDKYRVPVQLAGKATGAAIEHTPGAKSALTWISEGMAKMEGAYAGIIGLEKEKKARNEPYGIGDVIKAAKSGFERSASYQEPLGEAGVYFDILSPASGVVGEGAGLAMRTAGLPLIKAGAGAVGKVVPEGVKDVAALVNKPYQYKRMGIPEGLSIESELAGRSHQAELMKATMSNKEIRRLVPDEAGNKRLAMAVEDGNFEGLQPNEMQAYPIAQREKDLLEQRRISGQTVSPEVAQGLKEKMQKPDAPGVRRGVGPKTAWINAPLEPGTEIGYFPHMELPPRDRIISIDKEIAKKKAAGLDTTALEGMRKEAEWDAKSRVGQWMSGKRGRLRSFQQERVDTRTLRDKGDSLAKMNTDVARVLHTAEVETAKAEANRAYMLDYIDALKRKPTNVPDATWLDHASEGYTKVEPRYPGMPDNFYVRDDIHKAITGAAQRIANPEAGMLTGIAVFDEANRLFRNWNLFLRTSTLMNNFMGNVFNNYARLDMGPTAVIDYAEAGRFLAKKRLGTLDMEAASPVKGLTNGQLSDLFERERITGTGWSHEAGYQSGAEKTVAEKARGIAGSESILLEPGKKAFTIIEDWSRAAAYINQLKKGFNPRVAARNVMESLFDYELGLTGFEKDVLRRAMPFYSWTRFNIPLQLRMFVEHPERYINMARLGRGIQTVAGGPQPDESSMADWQRESIPLRYGYDPEKGYQELPLENVVPAAQALGMFTNPNPYKEAGNFFPTLNPLVQAGTNIDWFRSTPQRQVKIQDQPGMKSNVLGVNMDSRLAFLAKQIPPVRLAEAARNELQRGHGKEGAVKRLTLPYSFTFNPAEAENFANRKYAAQINDVQGDIRKMMRIIDDTHGYYTADQKSAARANVEILKKRLQELQASRKK